MMTLAQAHALLPGSALVGESTRDANLVVRRVHSDTRSLQRGDLFVALRGEHFDAHDFLAAAKTQGAVAALAERGLKESGLPGLLVADSAAALAELAGAWRKRLHLPLIAVTGSNGKTTVTQMIAAILRAWHGDAALATQGNFNNHIGLPLTLLRLRQDENQWHRAAVVELGMNHPGEIALLAALAAPTVALVNNAQREHQEFMAGVEAVARENGKVIEALGPGGVAVFPADDTYASLWRTLAGSRPTLSFALQGEADITAQALWSAGAWTVALHTPVGTAELRLKVAGLHNVKNSAAAAACALAAGCPLQAITQGLQQFDPVRGRSQVQTWRRDAADVSRDVTLIDDSYNANPDSVRAAIDVLAGLPGPHWLILGDMGEVGQEGVAYHREVGSYAVQRGIESLWTVGEASLQSAQMFAGARHFEQVGELLAALGEAPRCASALVKGSRFMKMERIVAALVGPSGS
ncbi:MAG: UDP-N-acetylmuramoyl-tripeptide--D-alanyl-D-alanine ligase [Burkholderiaceae bacterium]